MPDYTELLTRVDGVLACPVYVRDDIPAIAGALRECAEAIRTLDAERAHVSDEDVHFLVQTAIIGEREACAKICDSLASSIAAKLARPPARMESNRWFETMESAQEEAEECAAQIRARGNAGG